MPVPIWSLVEEPTKEFAGETGPTGGEALVKLYGVIAPAFVAAPLLQWGLSRRYPEGKPDTCIIVPAPIWSFVDDPTRELAGETGPLNPFVGSRKVMAPALDAVPLLQCGLITR